jgi:hypothetical protein
VFLKKVDELVTDAVSLHVPYTTEAVVISLTTLKPENTNLLKKHQHLLQKLILYFLIDNARVIYTKKKFNIEDISVLQ